MATFKEETRTQEAPDKELSLEALPELPVTHIKPSEGWISLNLRDLWEYHELSYFLTWRDIKVRYKQTVLGASWAVIQPFFTMIIFSIFFGRLAGMPSDGVPYPIFNICYLPIHVHKNKEIRVYP